MFHAARGLLHLNGYKEKSRVCRIIAVNELFVKTGLIESKFLEFLLSGKKRREDAIYKARYSEEIAKAHIEAAGEFLRASKKLIYGK